MKLAPLLSPLVLALALATSPAGAQSGSPQAFEAALTVFQQAVSGSESAIEPAVAQWRALSAAEPNDPVLRAYAGSATTLLATTTWMPWKKMRHAEDGLALLDKALAQLTPAHDALAHQGVPASLETRFVAANTFLALPSLFKRGDRGSRLLKEVLSSPLFESAPASFRAAVWLRAGQEALAAKRTDEARQWLQKAAASGTPSASAAQAQLKGL